MNECGKGNCREEGQDKGGGAIREARVQMIRMGYIHA